MFKLSAFADEIAEALPEQLKALNEYGVGSIELRMVGGKNIADHTVDEATEIYKLLQQHGITVSAIGSPIGKVPLDGAAESERKRFNHVLELARALHAPNIRLFSFYTEDKDANAYEVVRRMGQWLSDAKGSGVTLLHENEAGIYGDAPERNLHIAESLQADDFGLIFDAANYILCGYDAFDAFNLTAPHVRYMHIKDAKEGKVCPAGMGDGNLSRILPRVCDKHMYLSIEPHLKGLAGYTDGNREYDGDDSRGLFTLALSSLKRILDDTHLQYN